MSGHVPENLPVFEPAHSHSHHEDTHHAHHDTHHHGRGAVAHHAPTWVEVLNMIAAPIWKLTGDFQQKHEDDHGHGHH